MYSVFTFEEQVHVLNLSLFGFYNRTIYNCSYLSFCYVKIQYIKLNKPVFSVPELPPKDLASAQGHQGHDLHPCVGTLTAISKQRGGLVIFHSRNLYNLILRYTEIYWRIELYQSKKKSYRICSNQEAQMFTYSGQQKVLHSLNHFYRCNMT